VKGEHEYKLLLTVSTAVNYNFISINSGVFKDGRKPRIDCNRFLFTNIFKEIYGIPFCKVVTELH